MKTEIILISQQNMQKEAIYNWLGISNNYPTLLRAVAQNKLRFYALNKSTKTQQKIEKIINSGNDYLNFAAGVNFRSVNNFIKNINN
jgi:hypothetical protein